MKQNSFWFNNSNKSRFIKIDNKKFHPIIYNSLICQRCGNVVSKDKHRWISQCETCKTLISFFNPTTIQQVISCCENNILFNIGSYGSGKTTISGCIISNMIRRISGSRTICLAQTLQQLEKNAISELEKFFHKSEFKKQTKSFWELNDGSIIEFWPSDDPDKLKSANANFIWIVEGNTNQMQAMFYEALARIRNDKGFVYERDSDNNIVYEKTANGQLKPKVIDNMNMIIVEANPDDKSWTNRMVYNAHTVYHTEHVASIELLKHQTKPIRSLNIFNNKYMNSDIVAVLNATVDNPTLPDDYFINLRARCYNQSDYDRIVYCDITSKEGLVFKNLIENQKSYFSNIQQVDLFDNDIYFVEGLDPGGSNINNDPEGYLLCTFNKLTKELVVIDEHKISGLSLGDSIKRIQDIRRKWNWRRDKSLLFVADNALGKKYKSNSNYSLKNDYEIGLSTAIVLCNNKSISHGIKQVQEWLDSNAIKFSNSCEDLKKELFNYSTYTIDTINKSDGTIVKKEMFSEKENHLIDVLRYIIVTLETMGFKQYQHRIDYNNQMIFNNSSIINHKQYGQDKFDFRRFLPGGDKDIGKGISNKKFVKL